MAAIASAETKDMKNSPLANETQWKELRNYKTNSYDYNSYYQTSQRVRLKELWR